MLYATTGGRVPEEISFPPTTMVPVNPSPCQSLLPAPSGTNRDFLRISPDVNLGRNVMLYGFVNLYGCTIGDDTRVGCFVEIQTGVKIGSRCKISSHTFICEGVTLEDEVFVGHSVTFINDRWPRATDASGAPLTRNEWLCLTTLVKHGASIGSGSTILGGVTIGENAMVGAGSVVTHDVPPNTTVAGNPACPIHGICNLAPDGSTPAAAPMWIHG